MPVVLVAIWTCPTSTAPRENPAADQGYWRGFSSAHEDVPHSALFPAYGYYGYPYAYAYPPVVYTAPPPGVYAPPPPEPAAPAPDIQREVLVMKVWGGLSFPQIAAAVGVPHDTAASRYRYALARLRQLLAEETVP